MKKLFLIPILTIGCMGLTISESNKVKIELKSNQFHTKMNILVEDKKLSNLIENIQKIDFIIKSNNLCKIPLYSINPRYIYLKKRKMFDKYEANLQINCKFKTNEFDKFSKILENLSKNSIVNVGKISPYFDLKTKNENLKKEAYRKAQNRAKRYSEILKKSCFVKNIFINEPKIYRPKYRALKESLPVPQTDRDFSISFNYEIECFNK